MDYPKAFYISFRFLQSKRFQTPFKKNLTCSKPAILIVSIVRNVSISPLITRENLYLDKLIRHSFFCTALFRICLVSSPTLTGSWSWKRSISADTHSTGFCDMSRTYMTILMLINKAHCIYLSIFCQDYFWWTTALNLVSSEGPLE